MPDSKFINTLRIIPPSFAREILVPFPEGKLPVCQDCKTICSTRDACRVAKKHLGAPWSTSWVCIVVDRTVSPSGTSMLVDAPYNVLDLNMYGFQNHFVGNFDESMPVCQHCKKTNRTKHYCRTKHSHGAVPWNASVIHVSLSDDPLRDAHPSEVKVTASGMTIPASYTFLVEVCTNVVRSRPLQIAPPGSLGPKRAKKEGGGGKTGVASKSKNKSKGKRQTHNQHTTVSHSGGSGGGHTLGFQQGVRSGRTSRKNVYGVSTSQSMADRRRKKTQEIIIDANDSLSNIGHLNAVHVKDKLRIHWQGTSHAPKESVYIPPGYSTMGMYPGGLGGLGYPTFENRDFGEPSSNDVEGSNVLAEMVRGRTNSSHSTSEVSTGVGSRTSGGFRGEGMDRLYPYVPPAKASVSRLLLSAESSRDTSKRTSPEYEAGTAEEVGGGDAELDALKLFNIGRKGATFGRELPGEDTAKVMQEGGEGGYGGGKVAGGGGGSRLDVIACAMKQLEGKKGEREGY
ncbi:hypothetical protein TrCOL_g6619 [Triparma columacea]|uniref:Uncharacterized protein n=1 Tax=Triparma columacea TaxID=722753 RepID=A0A9W7FYN3_9STRA|nr:hypothetical protein TrCOL_g6619 [Triparma columacea]